MLRSHTIISIEPAELTSAMNFGTEALTECPVPAGLLPMKIWITCTVMTSLILENLNVNNVTIKINTEIMHLIKRLYI